MEQNNDQLAQLLSQDMMHLLHGHWRASLSKPEAEFSRDARLQWVLIRDEDVIFGFTVNDESVWWLVPGAFLTHGFSWIATKLALDISKGISAPDEDGFRWLGEISQ